MAFRAPSSLLLLVLAACLWMLFFVFMGLHLALPSDGARLVGSTETGGLRVATFASYGLQDNDIVLAVGGQGIDSLKQSLSDRSRLTPQWRHGQTVVYTVLRQGEQRDVPVTLGRYPFSAIWARDWGAILVAILMQITMGYVFFKRPMEPIARAMFLAASAEMSSTTWSIGLTMTDLVGKAGFWLHAVSSTGVYMLVWVGALHALLLFPTPWSPLSRRRWIIPALYITPYLVLTVVTFTLPAADALGWQERMGQIISYLQAAYGLAAIAAAIRSFRAARDPVSRAQVRWVTTGFVIAFFFAFILGFLPELIIGHPLFSWSVLSLVGLVFPLTFAVAILRYQLFAIDLLINRTLVYAALTVIIAALYALLVGWMGALFQSSDNLLVSLLATGMAAILFQPARQRLQRAVNRIMYGERDDPYAVLTRLGQRLETTLAPDTVLSTIVETVAETLKLPYTAISYEDAGSQDIAATYGLPRQEVLALPLRYQHDLIGHLHVAPRSPDEPFTPAEMHLLNDIARQIGVAAHNVRLTADLQRSRESLVAAREEERRRLRRDLHDGLGPSLASQTLTLTAARRLLEHDPQAADELLKEAIKHAQTATDDVRRVVYELRPPALDDLGLFGAIRAQVGRFKSNGLSIDLNLPDSHPALPAAVEVACFMIFQEALANVLRHAEAGRCNISIHINRGIELKIRDDGRGIAPDRPTGVGLSSMRQRAEELGGTLQITSLPQGGTQVLAQLPLKIDRV